MHIYSTLAELEVSSMLKKLNHTNLLRYAGLYTWALVGLPIILNIWFLPPSRGVDGDGVGLHTLRHSAATAMLDAGVPLHVVSKMLGHSSVAITGDIYGHADDARQRDAVDMLGAALGL